MKLILEFFIMIAGVFGWSAGFVCIFIVDRFSWPLAVGLLCTGYLAAPSVVRIWRELTAKKK